MPTPHRRKQKIGGLTKILTNKASALCEAAFGCMHDGRYAEAESRFEKALEILQGLRHAPQPDILRALSGLGMLLTIDGRPVQAIKILIEALGAARRLPELDDLEEARLFDNLGGAYYALGYHEEAERSRWRSLHLTEKALGQNHSLTATRLANLALVVEAAGRVNDAEALHLTAIDIARNAPDMRKGDLAKSLMNLGSLYLRAGWFEESERRLQESLGIFDEAYAQRHPDCAGPRVWLGHLHYTRGQLGSGREHFRQALVIEERLLGFDHETTAVTRWWLERVEGELRMYGAL